MDVGPRKLWSGSTAETIRVQKSEKGGRYCAFGTFRGPLILYNLHDFRASSVVEFNPLAHVRTASARTTVVQPAGGALTERQTIPARVFELGSKGATETLFSIFSAQLSTFPLVTGHAPLACHDVASAKVGRASHALHSYFLIPTSYFR
jgi:hypothetical protein